MAETQHKIRPLFKADANNFILLSGKNFLKLISVKYFKTQCLDPRTPYNVLFKRNYLRFLGTLVRR